MHSEDLKLLLYRRQLRHLTSMTTAKTKTQLKRAHRPSNKWNSVSNVAIRESCVRLREFRHFNIAPQSIRSTPEWIDWGLSSHCCRFEFKYKSEIIRSSSSILLLIDWPRGISNEIERFSGFSHKIHRETYRLRVPSKQLKRSTRQSTFSHMFWSLGANVTDRARFSKTSFHSRVVTPEFVSICKTRAHNSSRDRCHADCVAEVTRTLKMPPSLDRLCGFRFPSTNSFVFASKWKRFVWLTFAV